jgi:hypothetical protein
MKITKHVGKGAGNCTSGPVKKGKGYLPDMATGPTNWLDGDHNPRTEIRENPNQSGRSGRVGVGERNTCL